MPRETGTPPASDMQLGIPIDVQTARDRANEFSELTVPGSKQDETFQDNPEDLPSSNSDLDTHIKAADLDHPMGSIKLKHLETQVRALLESLIQGEDEAVFRENVVFEELVTFNKTTTFKVSAVFEANINAVNITASGVLTGNSGIITTTLSAGATQITSTLAVTGLVTCSNGLKIATSKKLELHTTTGFATFNCDGTYMNYSGSKPFYINTTCPITYIYSAAIYFGAGGTCNVHLRQTDVWAGTGTKVIDGGWATVHRAVFN